MSSGYKWKAGLFSGEGGVLRWRKYAIFSYFLCGTLGIWKKACPFIRGTKGSGQGHIGLEVNTSQCFSQSWRRWRSPSPQLFMPMLTVYGALPIRGARCWRLRAVHSSSCRPLRSCVPNHLLGMCANWGWEWEGTWPSSELEDSGTEVRTGLCSSPKDRHQTVTLHGLPLSQEAFPGQTGWLTCWEFIDATSSLV